MPVKVKVSGGCVVEAGDVVEVDGVGVLSHWHRDAQKVGLDND